jgi:Ser-tRNA(Ala) deacylase AlaX
VLEGVACWRRNSFMMDGWISTKRTILYPSTGGKSGCRGVMDGVNMAKSEIMARGYMWVNR